MTSITNTLSNHRRATWSGRIVRVMIVASLLMTYLIVRANDQTALGEVGGTTELRDIDPFRLVDTRVDYGVERLDAKTYKVRTRENAQIPQGAEAIAVSIVVTGATEPGHLAAGPIGDDRELVSTMTYEAGVTTSAGAVITLNEWGNFEIYSHSPVDVVIDVTGAFVSATESRAGRFVSVEPDRVIDTRTTVPMAAGQTTGVQLPPNVPADAIAAIVTLTSAAPNQPGYFTAYANDPRPFTSTLNVSTPNTDRASTAIVPVVDRQFKVYSSSGGHLIVDLVGYFTGSSAKNSKDGLFVPTAPKRRLDTRNSAAMRPGEIRGFDVSGGVALGSLTLIGHGSPGHAVMYANGTKLPKTSAINLSDTSVISNMAVSSTSNDGVSIYSSTAADFVFDQFGYFVAESVATDRPSAPKAPVTDQTPQPIAAPTPAPTPTAPQPAPQPAPSTPTAPTASGCTVSNKLVPSCGVWFGASTPSRDGGYDYERGLVEYENVAQNTPDILHFYHTGTQTFPNAKQIAMAERPGKQRSLFLFNWKPSGKYTWRQVANGNADAEIAKVASNLKKYPHNVFLNIFHEPEDNVRGAGSGMTAGDYADMYRHVVDELRGHGVSNAVYVWNPMGYYGWREHFDGLYPGHSYVDWVCFDPYYKNNIQKDFGELVNRNRPDINWPGFYEWATNKAPGKPLMMCEWGVDLLTNSDPAGFLKDDMASQLEQYPMLKALVYWNDIDKVNARIDEKTSKGLALGQAFKSMAAQPIFNAMTPDSAR